jgi:ribosomal protein L6P/L9E
MKELEILKQKKNVKVFLKDSILTVQGPLGEISQKIKLTNFNDLLFISVQELDLFLKIIKKLIKSVTYG